jgi:hypothetical protein
MHPFPPKIRISMHVVAVIQVGGAGSNVDLRAGNGGASCIGMSESEPLEDELDESDELAFELLIMLDIDGSSWFRTCPSCFLLSI